MRPPVAPMLAKLAPGLPEGEGFVFEPKWDGFRALMFRCGSELEIASRNQRPMVRYFPDLIEPLSSGLPQRCVVDGEIVVPQGSALDFDALLSRIHPAASRVAKLAAETPASFVAFDLLALGDRDLRGEPFGRRRQELEACLAADVPRLHLTPATSDRQLAAEWFSAFEGAGLDGVVAKRADLPYLEGERAMLKVKHERSADCVVAGFRWHKDGAGVGSLLLGLYDEAGVLHHVGVASSLPASLRSRLATELEPLEDPRGHPWLGPGPPGRRPGGTSRWSAGRPADFEPLAPERVCEVAYGQLQAGRFRHAARFLRWRPDRDPTSCRYSQLEAALPAELSAALGASG